MTLLEELYERIGQGKDNGLFPGAVMGEISDGNGTILAITVKTKFLTRAERIRLRPNFKVRDEGDKLQYAHIIEKQKPEKKSQPKHLLNGIIRIIRST